MTFIEKTRLAVSKEISPEKKSQLGQFFTPESIARFMADMFVHGKNSQCRLLDAGAGIGSLSTAFLEKWASGKSCFEHVQLDAFEVDTSLIPDLTRVLDCLLGGSRKIYSYSDITRNQYP